jgi:hypothetical protein
MGRKVIGSVPCEVTEFSSQRNCLGRSINDSGDESASKMHELQEYSLGLEHPKDDIVSAIYEKMWESRTPRPIKDVAFYIVNIKAHYLQLLCG